MKHSLFPFLLVSLLLHAAILLVMVAPVSVAPPSVLEVQLSPPVPASRPQMEPAPPAQATPRPESKRSESMLPVKPVPLTSALTPTPTPSPEPSAPVAPSPSSAATSAPPERAPVGGNSAVIFDAAYLLNPPPEYPAQSRRLEEEGMVKLNVRVGADGRALAVELASSSGFKRLDKAAEEAVRQWRFVPAKRAGQAIEGSVIVPVRYTLNE